MRCRACGNDRNFLVQGKELRTIDAKDPYAFETFFVPVKAVCMNPNCSSKPCTDIELDPLHPDIASFAGILA